MKEDALQSCEPPICTSSGHPKRAIQVEGETRGLQTVADRFVLVRAWDFKDAERRLARMWKSYAEPYLNAGGQAVRWQLEKIVDVFSLSEDQIDPSGTEVYSSLSQRRLKPEHVWKGPGSTS